ncbi:MAG: small multi-drug export protein [Candidatus Moranbacteria bacterium]|nr:small multi-drug export protein [Candidatus Moranbacteria bacterium]
MQEIIISWFSGLPSELATFLTAMMPITELRASIPVAIVKYEMHPFWAWFWSVTGNTIMGGLVMLFVNPVSKLIIERIDFINRFWNKYIDRIRTKNTEKFEKWGALALITFVAIPLPATGAFTGAVAASIFRIDFKKAILSLLAGCAIAGIIVTGITLGFNGIHQ